MQDRLTTAHRNCGGVRSRHPTTLRGSIMFSDILLTVDYDRTLTAPDSTIPQRNIEAIEYFMAHGGTFTVNTGRSIPMASGVLIPQVPVNAPLLLYNGSGAYDKETGRLTRYTPIDLDPAVIIRDISERFPQLRIEIQALDAHYLTKQDTGWEKYCQNNHCPWDYCTPEQVPQPFIKITFNGQFRSPTVADMCNATEEELLMFDRLCQYLQTAYGDKIDTFHSFPRLIDCQAKGVSKLKSAKLLQQELHKKILICVGDADNDVNMLDGADHAFCPADGIVANRYETVCPCAEGAIADVIYEKIPAIIKKQP